MSAAASQSKTAAVLSVRSPADGSLVADVPVDPPAAVASIAADLRLAQPAWEALSFDERARWLRRMRDWLLDNERPLVEVMQAESGKVPSEARLEFGWVSDIINFYCARGAGFVGDKSVRPHLPLLAAKRFQVVRRPYPLVGVIGPWNFPVVLSFGDAVPALLAGCAVVLKPSELTPLTCREVVQGWREELGAPLVLDVASGGTATGEAVVDAADMVQFTGSVATGRSVARRAADTLTPVSLELGGKDPMVVLADADLERAANAAVWGGFVNGGQVCLSIERVYVERQVYDDFLDRVVAKVRALRQGIDLGAMISPQQISIVEDHVEDARRKGARVLTGGQRSDRTGDWYEPTVIADVDHTMTVMREETFGPVLPIMPVADEAEAVRLANDSDFGLGASVFSRKDRGEELARRIEAGAVNVNDALVSAMCIDVPMSGWKSSGIGSRSGEYGMLKYTRPMTVCSPRGPALRSELVWFPYTPRKSRWAARAYRFFNARGLSRRLRSPRK